MNELEVYKRALGAQANRVANLTANLDIANAQIDMLNEQLEMLKKEKENSESEKDSK